jgi:hypothetical protein
VARYRIDPGSSRLWISARSPVHPMSIWADGIEGELRFDLLDDGLDLGAGPEGWLTLPVERLSAGRRLEDVELLRRIEARRFPTIDGVLTSVDGAGPAGGYHVTGEVGFHGVTRRCKDVVTLERLDSATIRLVGRSSFDVREFGIDPPRWLFVRMEPEVEVRVEIMAQAVADAPEGGT